MKKSIRIVIIVIAAVIVLWGAMFTTDFIRAGNLREPVFARLQGVTADDGGSGTYQGLGYTVNTEIYTDAEYGRCVQAVEMLMFGKVISASIS